MPIMFDVLKQLSILNDREFIFIATMNHTNTIVNVNRQKHIMFREIMNKIIINFSHDWKLNALHKS